MTTHELKSWPLQFEPVWARKKRFELRVNDRSYRVGDVLRLREWDPLLLAYTGRAVTVQVTYLIAGPRHGLAEGWVVMSLGAVQPWVIGSDPSANPGLPEAPDE